MPRYIERGQVADLLAADTPVVDVLSTQEHEELRIAGSVGIWLRELDDGSVTEYTKSEPLVVYCHDYL